MHTLIRFLPVALLLNAALALGFESRLEVDKTKNLAELAKSGTVSVSTVRDGKNYRSDASAVLKNIDLAKLVANSADYDRYVKMGMPFLEESKVVDRTPPHLLYTWAHMSISVVDSYHFLEVRKHDDGNLEWQLVRKRSTWPQKDDPAFTKLDGSWFIQPQPDGTVYVRYYLALYLDRWIPPGVHGIVKSRFSDGVTQVIQVLARHSAR